MRKSNVFLTKEGLDNLRSELEDLKKTKLPEVLTRLASAREDGDISENSAYQLGKQEQEFLEGRIEELEEILSDATVVSKTNGHKSRKNVDLGCEVTVSVNGKKQSFLVVGDWEAKPAEKKISGSSPLGQALMGKTVGDKVEVAAPAGKLLYTILNIK